MSQLSPNPIDLEAVVKSYLAVVPTPSDDQLHRFSESLGIPYETFEEQVFKIVGEEVEELDEDNELDVGDVDPLDLFLTSFFLLNSEPTEAQVHALAPVIGLTPEQLEERIYQLHQHLSDEDDDELDLSDDLT